MSGQSETPLQIRPHAARRMAERGITEAAIRFVLANYDTKRPAGPRETSRPADIYIGEYAGRRLKVYLERDVQPATVATVVWEGD